MIGSFIIAHSNFRFLRGAIDGSINLPDSTQIEIEANNSASQNSALKAVLNDKSKVKVVVGNKAHPGMNVSGKILMESLCSLKRWVCKFTSIMLS